MFKRGFTIWNILALGIALALAFAYPEMFPRKHPSPTQTHDRPSPPASTIPR